MSFPRCKTGLAFVLHLGSVFLYYLVRSLYVLLNFPNPIQKYISKWACIHRVILRHFLFKEKKQASSLSHPQFWSLLVETTKTGSYTFQGWFLFTSVESQNQRKPQLEKAHCHVHLLMSVFFQPFFCKKKKNTYQVKYT